MQMRIGSSECTKGFPKILKVKANWVHIVDEVTLPFGIVSIFTYSMQKMFLQTLLLNLSLLFKTTLLAAFGEIVCC